MKIKKLVIKRETIRDLSSSELDKVAGGGDQPVTLVSCWVTGCGCDTDFGCPPSPTVRNLAC